MRTINFRTPGDAKVLRLAHVDAPVPQAGQVRVRMVAAGVNPVDIMTRAGEFHRLGWIDATATVGLGWDIAGYVDALGEGVSGFAIGDAVAGMHAELSAPCGAYGDQLVMPVHALANLPENLGFTAAASLPLNALTADQALDALDLPKGASLLITGAAGG